MTFRDLVSISEYGQADQRTMRLDLDVSMSHDMSDIAVYIMICSIVVVVVVVRASP